MEHRIYSCGVSVLLIIVLPFCSYNVLPTIGLLKLLLYVVSYNCKYLKLVSPYISIF